MFGFFKKKKSKNPKEFYLVAPVKGRALSLSEVADPVFGQRLAGNGVAIEPTDDIIVSPADGELTLVFGTKHAFALTLANGAEILVHIGIDTVSLNGEGFEQLATQGTKVKAGTPILKIDRKFIKSKGFSLITPVIITNTDNFASVTPIENINTVVGKTVVVKYMVK
jgi:PTS system D-glucosamine-specific IIA component/PTS system glucose-specific IIA component